MSERTIERMSGLDDLFGETSENLAQGSTLPISQIVLPPSQPRRYFDQEKLESLANSIKEVGLLEPIVVRDIGNGKYELIAGERRLKACIIAKVENIAVNIIQCDDNIASRIRLIENLQREDLNVFEETLGILELLANLLETDQELIVQHMHQMHHADKGDTAQNVLGSLESLTIQELFSKLGQITWQSFVTTRLPLLKLKDDIKEVLSRGELEYTKALAISKIKDDEKRAEVLKQSIDGKLSLSKIKILVENALALIPRKEEKLLPKPKEINNRFNKVSKAVKDSDIWDKPQELKQLLKYLTQIEKLLAETKSLDEDKNNSDEDAIQMQSDNE
jgi:ParB family transcriptional regulator, chromosome partitioning protein